MYGPSEFLSLQNFELELEVSWLYSFIPGPFNKCLVGELPHGGLNFCSILNLPRKQLFLYGVIGRRATPTPSPPPLPQKKTTKSISQHKGLHNSRWVPRTSNFNVFVFFLNVTEKKKAHVSFSPLSSDQKKHTQTYYHNITLLADNKLQELMCLLDSFKIASSQV
jgi:hypothetical protein